MRSVCVFCGSSPGSDPAFARAARGLGQRLAKRGIGLVYGGGSVGLMGMVADAALEAGGAVTGVIPLRLQQREVGHRGLTELLVVDTMHERKALMAERSDAFIMMPGGVGTLEEFFEVWTWAQLGIHKKPVGVLNVAGYYDPLLAFLDQMVEKRFLGAEHRQVAIIGDEPDALLDKLSGYQPPIIEKWLDHTKT